MTDAANPAAPATPAPAAVPGAPQAAAPAAPASAASASPAAPAAPEARPEAFHVPESAKLAHEDAEDHPSRVPVALRPCPAGPEDTAPHGKGKA